MGERRGVYRVLEGKPEGKRPLGRPRRRGEDNIKMDFQEMGCREEQNRIWVRNLPGPMHLGLKTAPLCPVFCTKLKEYCSFNKVSNGPYTCFCNIP